MSRLHVNVAANGYVWVTGDCDGRTFHAACSTGSPHAELALDLAKRMVALHIMQSGYESGDEE